MENVVSNTCLRPSSLLPSTQNRLPTHQISFYLLELGNTNAQTFCLYVSAIVYSSVCSSSLTYPLGWASSRLLFFKFLVFMNWYSREHKRNKMFVKLIRSFSFRGESQMRNHSEIRTRKDWRRRSFNNEVGLIFIDFHLLCHFKTSFYYYWFFLSIA